MLSAQTCLPHTAFHAAVPHAAQTQRNAKLAPLQTEAVANRAQPLQTVRSSCKPPACGGESGLRHAGRYALHQAIGSLLEDYSLVSFVPLDISTVRRCLPLWR